MPIDLRIAPERRRVFAKVRGKVTMSEMVEAIEASVSDPAFQPGFDVYSDHTEISEPISSDQVVRLTDALRSLASRLVGSRWAVVTRRQVSYGMMRMLSVYAEGVPMEVRVFYDADAAEAWLGSPKSQEGPSSPP